MQTLIKTIDPVAFDGAIPFTAPTELVHDTEEKERTRREVEEAEKQFQKQLQAVRSNLALLMERNAKAPAPEQLSPDDFLVDPEEKVKLEEVAQSKLNKVRASINKTNCTKRVLYERLKVICVYMCCVSIVDLLTMQTFL